MISSLDVNLTPTKTIASLLFEFILMHEKLNKKILFACKEKNKSEKKSTSVLLYTVSFTYYFYYKKKQDSSDVVGWNEANLYRNATNYFLHCGQKYQCSCHESYMNWLTDRLIIPAVPVYAVRLFSNTTYILLTQCFVCKKHNLLSN